jgi:hypothetical protein
MNRANYVVKGILGSNPQHHIHLTLEFGVPLVIILICRAHGVQVADLYVIVKAKHIGKEGVGVSDWDKLVANLFLFLLQWVSCCHRVCLVQVLVDFLNALIHFGAWRFPLIPVIHHHRYKCFPVTPTSWMGVLNTFDSIQVRVDVRQMVLIDGNIP